MKTLILTLFLCTAALAAFAPPIPISFVSNTQAASPPAPTLPTTALIARYEPAGMQQTSGTITGWLDSSGNGNNITGVSGSPQYQVINGRPTITNGVSDFLDLPLTFANSTMSVYIVGRSIYSTGFMFSPNGGGTLPTLYRGGNGVAWQIQWYNAGSQINTGLIPADNRCLIGFRSNPTDAKLFMDGETTTMSPLTASSGSGGFMGGMQISYEAMFIYNASQSDSDRAQLQAYVQANFGVGNTNKSNYLIATGDSLTYGLPYNFPTESWIEQLNNLVGSSFKFDNVGTPSETVQTMVTEGATRVDPMTSAASSAGFANIYALLWAGSNDIPAGRSAAQIESDIQTWHTNRHTALPGIKTVAFTIIDRGDFNGTQETTRAAVNAWLMANWNTFADQFVDLAANTIFQNPANTTYYQGDTVHLTILGYYTVAASVKAQLSL